MNMLRRAILAAALFAGLVPAFAQVPAPVPALPDTERRTSYSISASTCACNVNFALYGDGTDYQNWVEVFINGVRYDYNDASHGWTITSPSGSLSSLARPITNAVLTFNAAQTGTVQIVGARRPRRTSQFSENAGVSARNLNQVITDIISQNREIWDKTNDMTGRGMFGLPGEAISAMPAAATRAGKFMYWDATGLIPQVTSGAAGTGNVVGPPSSTAGHYALWDNSAGTLLRDGGAVPVINVQDTTYGAKCDGTTDDTAAIQAAINAANTNTGGTVIFPAATCVIASTLDLTNKGNITLQGQGAGRNLTGAQTRLSYTAASGSALNFDGAIGIIFEKINLVYTNASYNGDLVDLRQVSGTLNTNLITFRDCSLQTTQATGTAASFFRLGQSSGSTGTLSFRLERCFLEGAIQAIKGGAFSNNIFISNNFFNTHTGTTSHIGVRGEGWTLLNNTFEPTAGTVANNVIANGAVNGLAIIGNTFNDGTTGTLIGLTGGVATGVQISGNILQGGDFSINLGSAVGAVVNGNYLNSNSVNNLILNSAVQVTAQGNYGPGTLVGTLPSGTPYLIDRNNGSTLLAASGFVLATALAETSGGTGQSTYTTGDILYASASNTLSKLADIATGNALISGGVSTAPSWGKITSSHLNITTTTCTNQFLTAISATGTGTCTTATLASAQFANQGTTSTVLHGNASGNPSFGSVVSADLNITTTTCTNQFLTAISATGTGTCTTDTLAGAQHANQGTTTTVLHGNAAGNPSWTSIVSADLNITTTTCTNQFLTAISATATGTCTTATLAGAQFANQGTTTTVLHGNASGNPSWGQVALSTDISGFGTSVASTLANNVDASGGFASYTTGTWTPTVTTSGTVGTPAYSIQSGSYEKIGRLVIAHFYVSLSGWTGSPTGNVSLAGLPFTSNATTNDFGTCNISNWSAAGLAANNFGIHAFVGSSATTAALEQQGSASATQVTAAQAGTTFAAIGACFYHT